MAVVDFRSVLQVLHEVYNLAGQTSVGLSFQQPVETLESIATGTLNLLEAIRFWDRSIRFYNAGSSECFGDTGAIAADENTAFRPRCPYGAAKATAFWEVTNYREAYDLFTCSGILFNHESPLRPPRFVTQKIVQSACRIAAGSPEKLTLGKLEIERDGGLAPEYVEAMYLMLQQDKPADYVTATASKSLCGWSLPRWGWIGKTMWRSIPACFVPPTFPSARAIPAKPQCSWGGRLTINSRMWCKPWLLPSLQNSKVEYENSVRWGQFLPYSPGVASIATVKI